MSGKVGLRRWLPVIFAALHFLFSYIISISLIGDSGVELFSSFKALINCFSNLFEVEDEIFFFSALSLIFEVLLGAAGAIVLLIGCIRLERGGAKLAVIGLWLICAKYAIEMLFSIVKYIKLFISFDVEIIYILGMIPDTLLVLFGNVIAALMLTLAYREKCTSKIPYCAVIIVAAAPVAFGVFLSEGEYFGSIAHDLHTMYQAAILLMPFAAAAAIPAELLFEKGRAAECTSLE